MAAAAISDETFAAPELAAADRYPDRVELRHNLVMALVEAQRFPEAIAVIEDVPEPLQTEGMREALEFARGQEAAD